MRGERLASGADLTFATPEPDATIANVKSRSSTSTYSSSGPLVLTFA
jgi:hypothetical protein